MCSADFKNYEQLAFLGCLALLLEVVVRTTTVVCPILWGLLAVTLQTEIVGYLRFGP